MERLFQILAAVLIVAAAYFYLSGWPDATFAAVVFSACSLFLGMRFRLKAKLATQETAPDDDALTDEDQHRS